MPEEFKDVKIMMLGDLIEEMVKQRFDANVTDIPHGSVYEKQDRYKDRFSELKREINRREEKYRGS